MTKEERNAYSLGYAAGAKRKARNISREREIKKENRLYNAAYLAAITGLLSTDQRWTQNGEKVDTTEKYASLAAGVAINSLKHMRKNT